MKKRMLNLRYVAAFILLGIALQGCQKNELDASFKGDSHAVLSGNSGQGARQDSILYSFAVFEEDVQEYEVSVSVRTLGNLSSVDRTVRLVVDADSTTALPTEYSFPQSVIIPAGGIGATVPVTIKRSARISDTQARLVLRVDENQDFRPGPRTRGTLVNSGPSFRIIWTDELTKPPFWDPSGNQSLRWVWGTWSKAKHQLIIDLTGIRDFSELTTLQKYYIQSVGLEYITQYRAAHGGQAPKNESDQDMGFCGTCN